MDMSALKGLGLLLNCCCEGSCCGKCWCCWSGSLDCLCCCWNLGVVEDSPPWIETEADMVEVDDRVM